MTDDIVTRLQCFTCEELNCESDVICREAADEIERLREKEVEARNDAYRWRKIAAIIMDDCIPSGHKDFYLDQFCNKYPDLAKVFIDD